MLFIMLFAFAGLTLAQGNLMTVHCDGSSATDSFFEGEEVCIYGVGFESKEDVDILLEEGSEVVSTSTETTNDNGVISLRNIWSNLTKGIYSFFADLNNNGEQDEHEQKQSLFVIGEALEENPETDIEEVPEFGTIASLVVLAAAGLFIYKKRGAN